MPGMVFFETKICEGPKLKEGDTVELLYKLALSEEDLNEGRFVESTYSPDIPIRIKVSRAHMLAGVYEGVIGMGTGGSLRRIFIPAELGYGNRAWKEIPKNQDLVIDVCVARIIIDN